MARRALGYGVLEARHAQAETISQIEDGGRLVDRLLDHPGLLADRPGRCRCPNVVWLKQAGMNRAPRGGVDRGAPCRHAPEAERLSRS